MWIYIMATVGTLLAPFIGAILFTSVPEPKIWWTWGPIGILFFLFGILFLFAFRKFNDSNLIAESNYSRLDDSEDFINDRDSIELSGVKVKQFDVENDGTTSYNIGARRNQRASHDIRAYNSNNSVDILGSGRLSHQPETQLQGDNDKLDNIR